MYQLINVELWKRHCITLLKETLQNEVEIAIQWFKDSLMILNPGKFQAMVIIKFEKMENKHEMYIENKKITSDILLNY